MMSKADVKWGEEQFKKFRKSGLKLVEEGDESAKIHWAQDPEEILLKQRMEEDKKLHSVEIPKNVK